MLSPCFECSPVPTSPSHLAVAGAQGGQRHCGAGSSWRARIETFWATNFGWNSARRVCVYVCICIYIYIVCVCIYINQNLYISVYICIYNLYIYVYIYMYISVYIYILCIYVCVCCSDRPIYVASSVAFSNTKCGTPHFLSTWRHLWFSSSWGGVATESVYHTIQ